MSNEAIVASIGVAIPLSVAGLFLTMIGRTLTIPMVHFMDKAAKDGDIKKIEMWHISNVCSRFTYCNTSSYFMFHTFASGYSRSSSNASMVI